MKTFKPSPYFVSRVMAQVRAYEASRIEEPLWVGRFLSFRTTRYALACGGALAGLLNLVRMYLAVFSPVVCR